MQCGSRQWPSSFCQRLKFPVKLSSGIVCCKWNSFCCCIFLQKERGTIYWGWTLKIHVYYRWTSAWVVFMYSLVPFPALRRGRSRAWYILSRVWRQGIDTTVFLSDFSVLHSFCSQRRIAGCPRRTSWFLESVSNNNNATHAQQTPAQSLLPFSPSGAVSDTLKICYTSMPCDLRPLYINQRFMCNRCNWCTSRAPNYTWVRDFVRLHASLRECLKQTDRLYIL